MQQSLLSICKLKMNGCSVKIQEVIVFKWLTPAIHMFG